MKKFIFAVFVVVIVALIYASVTAPAAPPNCATVLAKTQTVAGWDNGTLFLLAVKTDAGETGSLRVDYGQYALAQIGDRVDVASTSDPFADYRIGNQSAKCQLAH